MRPDIKQYIKCIANGEFAPSDINQWSLQCEEAKKPVNIKALILVDIICRLVNLNAMIKSLQPPDSKTIIQAALALDSEMAKWEEELPGTWIFIVKQSTDCSEMVYNGQEHVYPDF